MYHIGIHGLIKRLDEIFYFIGMWQNEETPIFRKIVGYLVFIICAFGFAVALVSGAILTDSKDEAIFLVGTSVYIIVLMIRNNNIRYKRKQIMTLLHDNCLHSFANETDFVVINKRIKQFLNFAISFIILVSFPVPLSSLYVAAVSKDKALPLNIAFPFNWKENNFAYGLGYVYYILAFAYVVLTTYINALIWYLMIGLSIQYDNLGFRLRDMGFPRTTSTTDVLSENHNLFHRDLLELIQLHKKILKDVNEFKSLFSYIFFIQIMTSGICICGSIYAITIASRESQFQLVIYIIQMLYGIFDIFMLMYLGNDIKASSNRLSYYVFESNWLEQSKSTIKSLIILTENLQQPHELMIYKLYPLNSETFTSILRAAYSMFNILRNT